MQTLQFFLALLILLILAACGYLYMGYYDVAADQPHYAINEDIIDWVRERSVKAHSLDIRVPDDLNEGERIRRGAGQYDAMCVHCHLSPGMKNTEIRKGLYPRPPDLTRRAHEPAEEFWVIKHGLKMTGMPAWGQAGVDDESIWDMVALLQALPDMPQEVYETLVVESAGHHHEGMTHSEPGDTQAPAEEKLLEELPITNEGQPRNGNMSEAHIDPAQDSTPSGEMEMAPEPEEPAEPPSQPAHDEDGHEQ